MIKPIGSSDSDCPNCGIDLISEVERMTQSTESGYRTRMTIYCPMCETEVDFTVDWEPTWATLVDHRLPTDTLPPQTPHRSRANEHPIRS